MGRRSSTAVLVLLGTLLLVGCLDELEAGRFSVEDLAELDLTEEERAVMRLEGEESDNDDFDYNPLGKSGAGPNEEDIVVLIPDEFDAFVKTNQFVLVHFHAPWCGHCQKLAPEYGKAATALKERGVVLVKVDAVEHVDFAHDQGVKGYPTLFFYANGEKKPYTGERTSDDIISWVEKRIGPVVSIINSAEEVLENETPIAVAYLDRVEGGDAEEFIAAARQEDEVQFYMTADAGIAKKFGLDNKPPALMLLKKQNEKVATFDGSFVTKAISDFVSENKLPLVITFTRNTAHFGFDSDIKNQLLFFAYPAEFEKMRGSYEAAAKSFKKKIVFVFVDLTDMDAASSFLEFFGLDNEKTRLLAFVAERIISKYLYDGDYSADSLKQFSEKFLARDLAPYLKSQKAPAENAGPVKIVVSSTFAEIVLDETKDVILEIHSPWCAPCKTLEPEYNKLGETLKNVPSIVVARIDASKNDVEGLKMNEYPMVLFYPAAKNAEPTSVAARTAARFIEFLKSYAKVPFEAPQIPEPEPERWERKRLRREPEDDEEEAGQGEEEEEADQGEEEEEADQGEEEEEAGQGEEDTDVKDEL